MAHRISGPITEDGGCWSKAAWLPDVFAQSTPAQEIREHVNDVLEEFLGARIVTEKKAAGC